MRDLRNNRGGVIYTIITICAFLFIIGLVFFAASTAVDAATEGLYPVINSYHNSSWSHYDVLGYAETFVTAFWTYLLVLAVAGLAYWVYHYEQRKGAGF